MEKNGGTHQPGTGVHGGYHGLIACDTARPTDALGTRRALVHRARGTPCPNLGENIGTDRRGLSRRWRDLGYGRAQSSCVKQEDPTRNG